MSVTKTPKWAVGMRKIGPGIYVDPEGCLHIDAEEICAASNVPFTAENEALAEQAAIQAFREAYGRELKLTFVAADADRVN